MGIVLQVTSHVPISTSAGATNYFFMGCGAVLATQSSETNVPNTYEAAGVLSNLAIRITACATTGGTSTVVTRKNATSDGNQTYTIPNGGSGVGFWEDATNTDTVAVGDKWNYRVITGTGGTMTVGLVSTLFTATTNTVSRLASSTVLTVDAVNANYYAIIAGNQTGGASTAPTTELAQIRSKMKRAGTLKNMQQTLSANVSTQAINSFIRVNGGDTGITVQFAASGGAAVYEDVSHTASVAVDDLINLSYARTSAGTGNATIALRAVDFESTEGYGVTLTTLISGQTPVGSSVLDGGSTFIALGGTITAESTESNKEGTAGAAFTFSGLGFYRTNNDTPVATLTFRTNTGSGPADRNQVAVGPASTAAGYFEDTTHTDVVAAGDLIAYKMAASSVSGNHNVTFTYVKMDSYLVTTQRVTNSNTLVYNLIGRVIHSNTLKYNVWKQVLHSNTLLYNLRKQVLHSNSLKYNLLKQILKSNIIKYNLIGRVVHSQTLKYHLLKQILHANTLRYKIWLKVQHANTIKYNTWKQVTKSNALLWNIVGTLYRITQQNSLLYNLIQRQTHANTLKSNILNSVAKANTLKYSLWQQITHSNTLKYNVLKQVLNSNTIKYNLLKQITHANTLRYKLVQQITKSSILKYNIIGRIIHSNTLKYNVLRQITKQNILKYNLIGRIVHANILKYNVLQQALHSNTIKYNLLKQALQSSTVKYNLLEQITKAETLLWNIEGQLARITHANILKYNIIQRQIHTNTIKYHIAQQATKANTLKYSIWQQITKSNILKYHLLQQIAQPNTLKYNLRQQITKQNSLLYNLRLQVTKANTIKYSLQQLIAKANTLKYNIIQASRTYDAQSTAFHVGSLSTTNLDYEVEP